MSHRELSEDDTIVFTDEGISFTIDSIDDDHDSDMWDDDATLVTFTTGETVPVEIINEDMANDVVAFADEHDPDEAATPADPDNPERSDA